MTLKPRIFFHEDVPNMYIYIYVYTWIYVYIHIYTVWFHVYIIYIYILYIYILSWGETASNYHPGFTPFGIFSGINFWSFHFLSMNILRPVVTWGFPMTLNEHRHIHTHKHTVAYPYYNPMIIPFVFHLYLMTISDNLIISDYTRLSHTMSLYQIISDYPLVI